MANVLIVEDELDLRKLLRIILERANHTVVEASDGLSALRTFHAQQPELVMLDVGLPGLDGWQVLERIRELSDVPVIMLTAHGIESDRVRGLNAGADDYVTKPFSRNELVARVTAALRRGQPATRDAPTTFTHGALDIDFVARTVRLDNTEVALTPLEYRLLVVFVRHLDQVLSPEELLAQAWDDPTGIGPDRVKFVVRRLREKLSTKDRPFESIRTVRGFGYRFRTSDG